MTPLQIQILLHYYCKATDYENFAPTANAEALEYFLENGYLEKRPSEFRTAGEQRYTPTEKLTAYCDALCNVPEPTLRWVVCNTKQAE